MRRFIGIWTVVLLVLAPTGQAAAVPQNAEAETYATESPDDFLRWKKGTIEVRNSKKAPAGIEPPIFMELVEQLNGDIVKGFATVSQSFDVQMTPSGVEEYRTMVETWSEGCLTTASVMGTWQGIVVTPTPTGVCTHDHGDIGPTAAGDGGTISPQRHTGGTPGANCSVDAWNYGAATIGLLLLVAFPPGGALVWTFAFAIGGYGFATASYNLSQSCDGAHSAKVQASGKPCNWLRTNYVSPYYRKFEVRCYP